MVTKLFVTCLRKMLLEGPLIPVRLSFSVMTRNGIGSAMLMIVLSLNIIMNTDPEVTISERNQSELMEDRFIVIIIGTRSFRLR